MSDDMKLLKSRLEKRLKEAAAENGGLIDHEATEGTAGGCKQVSNIHPGLLL